MCVNVSKNWAEKKENNKWINKNSFVFDKKNVENVCFPLYTKSEFGIT